MISLNELPKLTHLDKASNVYTDLSKQPGGSNPYITVNEDYDFLQPTPGGGSAGTSVQPPPGDARARPLPQTPAPPADSNGRPKQPKTQMLNTECNTAYTRALRNEKLIWLLLVLVTLVTVWVVVLSVFYFRGMFPTPCNSEPSEGKTVSISLPPRRAIIKIILYENTLHTFFQSGGRV